MIRVLYGPGPVDVRYVEALTLPMRRHSKVFLGVRILLMVMPSVDFNQPILRGDHNTAAAAGLPRCALPPGFVATSQFLDKSMASPAYDRVSEYCCLELYSFGHA